MGSGLADIVTKTRYDTSGRVVESRMPASNGTDAGTTITTYYTAAANATIPICGGKPAWAGSICQTGPKAQPSGVTIPVRTGTYSFWGGSDTVAQTSGAATRTTTSSYDDAARPTGSITTVAPAADGGTAIPAVSTNYDPTTGLPTTIITGSDSISWVYNDLGQVTSYTDADGTTTTTSYDVDGNTATRNDGKGTYTYTYDGTDSAGKVEHRGLATALNTGMGSALSTFTGAYDPSGALVSQTYPNALVATSTYDNIGGARTLTYAKAGTTWFKNEAHTDAQGRISDSASSASAQDYTYDPAGRLVVVKDTDDQGVCTTRSYAFNSNSTRASMATAGPDTAGDCTSAGATIAVSTYDAADRVTNTGYTYDKFGRTLTVPAGRFTNGSSGSIAVGYYANDMVRTQTQGTQAKTFTLDPMRRLREATDTTTGVQTRKITNHYDSINDSPAWIATDTTAAGITSSSWQRNVEGLAGDLAALQGPVGTPVLQLTNLHGDVIATVDDTTTATGTTATFESTEYGAPRATNTTNPDRYGWLGGKQRSNDDLGGLVLMGVRLYNPVTGKFISIDPIPGGNANAYTYPTDPINMNDLDGRWGCGWCQQLIKIKHWEEAEEIGLAAASYTKATGGSCRMLYGLRTCQGGVGHLYSRGGTTWGSTYVAAPGKANVTFARIRHEKVHRSQWRMWGRSFAYLYAAAGSNPCKNVYERQAGLWDGGYTWC